MYKVLVFILFTLLTPDIFAQEHVIRGNIKDDQGTPLPGATVAEIDKNNRVISGSITNINGNYVLKIQSADNRIQFSFIGYKTVTEDINNRTEINLQFSLGTTELEEIVVYAEKETSSISGISEQFSTGSSSKIDMRGKEGLSISEVGEALQGEIAGLDIMSTGSPGETGNVVIRGLSTIGNATPLIVIDGIAQQSYSDFDFESADLNDLSALLSVPVQDIKEVVVLKDATEAATWGAAGANGVIVITTHRGRKGKTRFSYNYKYTYKELPDRIPMLNGDEYILMQQEQIFNANPMAIIPNEIAYDPQYVDFHNYSRNTDWYDLVSKDGYIKEHGLKVEGGGDKTSYYVSLNFLNDEGQVLNEDLDKINSRVKLTYDISRRIRLTTNFAYMNNSRGRSWYYRRLDEDDSDYTDYDVARMAYLKAPNMSPFEYDQNGNPTGEYFNPVTNYQGSGYFFYNPLAMAELSKKDELVNQLSSDFTLDFDLILNKLKFIQLVSILNKGTKRNDFLPAKAIGATWNSSLNNRTTEANISNNQLLSRSLLIFKPFSNSTHRLESSLMWEAKTDKQNWQTVLTGLNSSNSSQDPSSNAIVMYAASDGSTTATLSALLTAGYSYKNKYVFRGNLRADGSSKFGANNRWGFFPSFGTTWHMKEEAFLENVRFLNRTSLSLSWGRVGNMPARLTPYARHGIYADGGQYIDESTIIPTQLKLDDLKWETKEEVSSSIDLSFFRGNRVTVLLEYYNKKTTDLAWRDYDIPTVSGFSRLATFNGGVLRNEGIDLTLGVNVIKTKDFDFSLRFNLNRNRNWFDELPDNQALEKNGTILENLRYPLKTQLGSPIGSVFGLRFLGVYASDEDAVVKNADGSVRLDQDGEPVYMIFNNDPTQKFEGGDAIYADINYDGVIDINDVVYLGNSNPRFLGGFGSTMKYKQFQLTSSFVYREGFSVVNQVAMEAESMTNEYNQSKASLYRWRKQGDSFEGIIPRAYQNHQFNTIGSDRFVEDVWFVKLNSLALSYIMGPQLKKKLPVKDLRITLNVRKVYTWTNYTGLNPELSTRVEDQFWVEKDDGDTPPPRMYGLTFGITF